MKMAYEPLPPMQGLEYDNEKFTVNIGFNHGNEAFPLTNDKQSYKIRLHILTVWCDMGTEVIYMKKQFF